MFISEKLVAANALQFLTISSYRSSLIFKALLITERRSSGDFGLNVNPVSPSSISSGMPAISLPMTGVPIVYDSIIVMGLFSYHSEGTMTKEAPCISDCNSLPCLNPKNSALGGHCALRLSSNGPVLLTLA